MPTDINLMNGFKDCIYAELFCEDDIRKAYFRHYEENKGIKEGEEIFFKGYLGSEMESKNAYIIEKNNPELEEIITWVYRFANGYLSYNSLSVRDEDVIRTNELIKKLFPKLTERLMAEGG